ncbi:hypothetical protein [Pseudogemmobacter faecipullorum]|uniref:PASTA domain-containing protein n=1 Tax=Pseudogemmobacter faecipullorum TaxID=2755041 RepID=A0ABS8CIY3_9RHOB|nr:hypothetical protein [Pseudogemmobacter faecipullorum]MCB5409358.1 hypothetical protein [Pseudogemmobacter faecipullorum]
MAEDWTAIAEEVAASLAEVGFTATLIRPGVPTGPEWEPVQGPPTTHPIRVMQDTIGLGLVDGAEIRASDIRVMMAAEGVTPTTADRIALVAPASVTITGSDASPGGMAIVRCEPFDPAAWRSISM